MQKENDTLLVAKLREGNKFALKRCTKNIVQSCITPLFFLYMISH